MSEPDRVDLCQHEYPRLVETLRRLIEGVRHGEGGPVTLVVLYGSIARLTPWWGSDTDVLVLYSSLNAGEEWETYDTSFIHLARSIEDELVDEHYRWPIMLMPGDAMASHMDEDFLASVDQDGVLLFEAEGAERPEALRDLRSFEAWQEDLRRLLERTRPAQTQVEASSAAE
jgi:predicted nucleotidyltransferase